MTLYEYLGLSNESQWDELWGNENLIDNYKSFDSKFVLYALHRFFVEVELCISTDNTLGKCPFEHGERMEKYLRGLDA
jgi:hypothetical protein